MENRELYKWIQQNSKNSTAKPEETIRGKYKTKKTKKNKEKTEEKKSNKTTYTIYLIGQ